MDCRQPWQPCRLLLFPITADTGKSLWIEACPCLVGWGAGCGLWLAVVEKPLSAQRLDERGRHGLVVLARVADVGEYLGEGLHVVDFHEVAVLGCGGVNALGCVRVCHKLLHTHNLEVPGSSPGWSTLKMKQLRIS